MMAKLQLGDDGSPRIEIAGRCYAKSIRAVIPAWEQVAVECVRTPWEPIEGKDALGAFSGFASSLCCNETAIVEQTLRAYGDVIVFSARFLQPVEGIRRDDSFESASVFATHVELGSHLRACVATYGLGSAEDPHGGYWPTVEIGPSDDLPSKAFGPAVLYGRDGALAIAPSSGFLTGSLLSTENGLGRGLHGSINRVKAGTEIETLFVAGIDVPAALHALGDVLLGRGGKQRPNPSTHLMTSALGWWNAYGGYYTEPIHPLAALQLQAVVDGIRERALPVAYLGLDLWYPYEQIGQGVEFAPDRAKYPDGLDNVVEPAGLPTVLHVSALAQPNAYGSDGSDGSIYERIGEEIRAQRGVAVWHDWMRTQQHLTPSLRSNPEAAERWYRTMTGALREQGLDVLQCMQTMGMALASTQAPNVRAARSAIDYLFALPEAMDTLAELGEPGFRREAIRPVELDRQNLLMGMFFFALGLLPFHDLFLTRFHEGVGGSRPEIDAVLRALSCGPVGIGDLPDHVDEALLARLVQPNGRLLQPDRPPVPDMSTLGEAVEIYWTEHRVGESRWWYALVLNLSTERQPFAVEAPTPQSVLIRDGISGNIIEDMVGVLDPEGVAYFVVSPVLDGIAPLGLVDMFVPAPAERFTALTNHDGLTLGLNEVEGHVGFHSQEEVTISADGTPLAVDRVDGVSRVRVGPHHRSLEVRRR